MDEPAHDSPLLLLSSLSSLTLGQAWTEQLREWLASSVLQPLVAAVDSAAADVVSASQVSL